MDRGWVFDAPHARRISERRKEFLDRLLRELLPVLNLKTALDVGCGIGFFSNYLSSLGLRVTGFDAREENIAEAKRRYTEVDFYVRDVEDPRIQQLGQFDLVLCFGLLYHLENPFRAVRNLYAVTGKVLIIETMVSPSQSPVATLMSECQGEDQGLHYVAFVPSEACLIKMLYQAGFAEVYRTAQLPDHEDFRASFSHQRRRTVLVASNIKLQSSLLRWTSEPQPVRPDIWQTRLGFEVQRIAGFYSSLRSKVRLRSRIRAILAKVSRRLPVLTRLPWGGAVLAWNDLVYSFGVIHHTPHSGRVVQQMRHYCGPGTFVKLMVYHRYAWKVLWILLTYSKGQFWRLAELVARHSEAQTGCPVTYTFTRREVRDLLEPYGFRVTEMWVDHIFPYRIPDYIQYRYVKVWYFRWMPRPLFRWLERHFGWHLCVTAEVATR